MGAFSGSLFAIAASLALTGAAGALTLTFDSIPQGPGRFPVTAVEQGVTISASPSSDGLLSDNNPGTIHLDDSGTANTPWVTFATGGVFSALSMDVIGLTMASFVGDWIDGVAVPYDNMLVEGFLNGAQVASASYSTGLAGGPVTFAFGAAFGTIDLLRIATVYPTGQLEGLPIECDNIPCGHVELDSVSLGIPAPVPVPAALPGLVAGLGALALLRRRWR